MLNFNVMNRWSGEIQFVAEIACSDDELPAVKLCLAVRWAVKTAANLDGANLSGANLSGANLSGANLSGQPVIDGGLRSDGYRFLLTNFESEGLRIKAGCRNRSPKEAIAHWKETRKGTQLGDESLLIVNHMLALAKLRGWDLKAKKEAA